MKKLKPLPLSPEGGHRSFLPVCRYPLLSNLQKPIAFGLGKHLMIWIFLFTLFFFEITSRAQTPAKKFVLVVHGGAGTILKSQMTPEKEKAYSDALNEALEKGSVILNKGGSALDAVEASVRVLEDSPLFNAGKGAVFTNEGKYELDASIMNGQTLEAGSVANVKTIKNPISAARAVMEKSPHVMMTGNGAELFAKEQGLEIVDPSYFYTEERWKGLQNAKREDSLKQIISVPLNKIDFQLFAFLFFDILIDRAL